MAQPLEHYYTPEPNTGCWLWTGYVTKCGYGRMHRKQGMFLAHRYFYEQLRAPIPEGLQLDHKCRQRCCVNPDHLEPVTNAVNIKRGWDARPRERWCRNGHWVAGENMYVFDNGTRTACRICAKNHRLNLLKRHGITHPRQLKRRRAN